MKLSRVQVRDRVIECLRDFLGKQGSKLEITERSNPIRHFGLDSPDGIAFACALSEKFDFTFPHEINPLVDDARHRGRRVDEIVDLMMQCLKGEQEVKHA